MREWNLWVRDIASGEERQLTHDGVEYFGYATDNAGWAGGPDAMAVWSPDSKRLATQQQDERNVGKMYLVSTPTGGAFSANGREGGHPVLRQVPFPLPGDSIVTMMYRVIVNADNGAVLRLKMPADFHRGTREDNIELNDTKWSPDGSQLAIASMSRDNKHAWISVANTVTGDVRHVMDETEKTQYKAPTGWQVTADAMFRYPDFFQVGIAESGNHDNRQNEDDWGERYQGLVVQNADGTDNYTAEANENFAQNLKGHLLLAHGSMDTNVPPYSTFLVVDALIKANKDFDLLILPNNNHGYTASQYMMRRRWDYFVRWLLNTDPPKAFTFGAGN